MKKTRKILAVALFLLLMLTPVVSVSQPVTVQAAAKTTLKKSGGRYYAYENGKKLCNAWRTIKSGKVSYTYYFGANGAAYQADKGMMGKYSVIVKKIKGQYYGFVIWDTELREYVWEVPLHMECHMYITSTQTGLTTKQKQHS